MLGAKKNHLVQALLVNLASYGIDDVKHVDTHLLLNDTGKRVERVGGNDNEIGTTGLETLGSIYHHSGHHRPVALCSLTLLRGKRVEGN